MAGPPRVYETLWGNDVPTTQQTALTTNGFTINQWLTVLADGWIVGMRLCLNNNVKTFTPLGFLIQTYNGGNSIVRACAFKRPPSWTVPPQTKWQHAYLRPRLFTPAGTTLRYGAMFPLAQGQMWNPGVLTSAAFTNGDLQLPQDTTGQHNGLVAQSGVQLILPNTTAGGNMYGLDVLFLKK